MRQTYNKTPWSQRWPHVIDEQSKTPEILEMLELDPFWGEVGHTNQGQNKDKPFFSPEGSHIFFAQPFL